MLKLKTGITNSVIENQKPPLVFHWSRSPLLRSYLHLKMAPLEHRLKYNLNIL